ncbi:MAG: hypothetical protein H0W22_05315, partial [Chloroflexi bacterium]|nr:hypothetical protein [Chloroflexota bacterium]
MPYPSIHRHGAAVLGGPVRVSRARHRRGRRLPAVRRHARGVGGRGGRVDPRDGGHPARGRGACAAPGRRAPSRDAGTSVRVLHLRRPGPGDRPGKAGRPARAVHRPRRAPRRRGPGDALGRRARADVLHPRDGSRVVPGDGGCRRGGEGVAAGTSVNVPLPPGTGEGAWLDAVTLLVPELAATFGPDLIVSQHGADSHAWDPLAHLNVTTTAHGAAARLVDKVAHLHASGRWLATGGGGYDAYRVVPRTWALTWLAGAHREVPEATPPAWRDRWSSEAARYGQAPLPTRFDDAPNAGLVLDATQAAAEERARGIAALVRRVLVPRLVQVAHDRGWWDPLAPGHRVMPGGGPVTGTPTILPVVDAATWAGLSLAPRVIAPADPQAAHRLVLVGLADG